MNHENYDIFLDLVLIDHEILDILNKKKLHTAALSEIESQLTLFKTTLLEAEKAVFNAQKKLHDQELESKTVDQRRNTTQKNLDQTMQAKDFFALTTELEALKKNSNSIEEKVFALWEEHEAAEKKYSHLKETALAYIPALEKDKKILAQRLLDLEAEQIKNEKARLLQAPSVDPELYEQYENLRKTTPYAAVPMEKESCSACFYPVNSADKTLLLQSQIVQCKDCYRLLYIRS